MDSSVVLAVIQSVTSIFTNEQKLEYGRQAGTAARLSQDSQYAWARTAERDKLALAFANSDKTVGIGIVIGVVFVGVFLMILLFRKL